MSSGERFALVHSSIPFALRPAHVILLIAQHETTLSFSKNIVLKRNYKIFLFYKGVSKTTE
ncbi:hypothetical protein [Leptospira noguchii]|uniref:Uncharacterized protein n=1 Tax=Leptospira noguchii str. 2001034031 TaxID=1193053 RepID=M6YIJ1_9LEPT|nr:hypothetical protein [Leptospira noguchii]EMO89434.1 hypothetical protein LEP1GSC024_1663 [Leptospira noguchii str. 2001034031]